MQSVLLGISILKRLLIVFVGIIEGKIMCYQLQLIVAAEWLEIAGMSILVRN